MREDGNGRENVFPWGDAPAAVSYALGEHVYSGTDRGTVVAVDADYRTISVEWTDTTYGPITYPIEATCLRKAMPWET